jgi:hypothetical protein
MSTESITWVLTPAEFAVTRERVTKINARAVKRGFTGTLELSGSTREITETDAAGLPRTCTVVDTTITGEAPSYQGWSFLAAVDSIETADGFDFILRTAPGVEESGVDRSKLAPGRCQHCNTTRTNRHKTFLVRNDETGQTFQVGSTCIKDFTGWQGRPVFISSEEISDQLEEHLGGMSAGRAEYSPETIVAAAWAISRLYGWVPASATGRTSTRDEVTSYLFGTSRADRELQRDVAPHIPDAAPMAQTIISALLEHLEGSGDYVTNLKVCLRAPHVEHRHFGIVVSAIAAYERMTGETARRKATAEERTARRAQIRYAGSKGEKITVAGTITRLMPFSGSYGYTPKTTMLVIVESPEVAAKMFTAASWAWDVNQGDQVTITGTVKDHEEYNGVQQTVLTRPKLISTTPAPAADGEQS